MKIKNNCKSKKYTKFEVPPRCIFKMIVDDVGRKRFTQFGNYLKLLEGVGQLPG